LAGVVFLIGCESHPQVKNLAANHKL
jgi:hypothetical protein